MKTDAHKRNGLYAMPTGTRNPEEIPQTSIQFAMDRPLADELAAYGERQTPPLSRNQVIVLACARLTGYDRSRYRATRAAEADDSAL